MSSAAAKRSRQGAIYAVKVGGDAGGSVRQIFAKALAEGLREHAGMTLVKTGSGLEGGRGVISAEELYRVVAFLIDELDMGASAQALGDDGHRYNEMIRAAAHSGIPMVARARGMLRDAWRAHDKEKGSGSTLNVATLRGKVRGMASLLAYVTSPYSWDEMATAERNTMIRDLENEARKAGLL